MYMYAYQTVSASSFWGRHTLPVTVPGRGPAGGQPPAGPAGRARPGKASESVLHLKYTETDGVDSAGNELRTILFPRVPNRLLQLPACRC